MALRSRSTAAGMGFSFSETRLPPFRDNDNESMLSSTRRQSKGKIISGRKGALRNFPVSKRPNGSERTKQLNNPTQSNKKQSMVEAWSDKVEPMIRKFLNEQLRIKPAVKNVTRACRSGYTLGSVLHAIGRPIPLSRFSQLESHAAIEHNFRILRPQILAMGLRFTDAAIDSIRNGVRGAALWLLYQIAKPTKAVTPGVSFAKLQPLRRKKKKIKTPKHYQTVCCQVMKRHPGDPGHLVRALLRDLLLNMPAPLRGQEPHPRQKMLEIMENVLPTLVAAVVHLQKKIRDRDSNNKHQRKFKVNDCLARFMMRHNPKRKMAKHVPAIPRGGAKGASALRGRGFGSTSVDLHQAMVSLTSSELSTLLRQEFHMLRAHAMCQRFDDKCKQIWSQFPKREVQRYGMTQQLMSIDELPRYTDVLLDPLIPEESMLVDSIHGATVHDAMAAHLQSTRERFVENITGMFRACDMDQSGFLSLDEFRLVVKEQLMTNEVITYMRFHGCNNADIQGSPVNQFQLLDSFLKRVMDRKMSRVVHHTDFEPEALFARVDTDHDGVITAKDMELGLVSAGFSDFASHHILASAIDHLDHREALTLKDFKRFLRQFLSPEEALELQQRRKAADAIREFHKSKEHLFRESIDSANADLAKGMSYLAKIKNLNRQTALHIQKAMLTGHNQDPVPAEEIDKAHDALVLASAVKHGIMAERTKLNAIIQRAGVWPDLDKTQIVLMTAKLEDAAEASTMSKDFEQSAREAWLAAQEAFNLARKLESQRPIKQEEIHEIHNRSVDLAEVVHTKKREVEIDELMSTPRTPKFGPNKGGKSAAKAKRMKGIRDGKAKHDDSLSGSTSPGNASSLDSAKTAKQKRENHFPWVALGERRFNDNPTITTAFKSDWQKLTATKSYKTWLREWAASSRQTEEDTQTVLKKHFESLARVYRFYSHSGMTGAITLSVYNQLIHDCQILDSQTCPQRTCHKLFQMVASAKDRSKKVKRKDTISRSNFLELLLHLGVEKYSAVHDRIVDCVKQLIEDDILAGFAETHPEAATPEDSFRRDRLYTPFMKKFMKPLIPILEVLFKVFSVPAKTGSRGKRVRHSESGSNRPQQMLPGVDGATESSADVDYHVNHNITRVHNMPFKNWVDFLDCTNITSFYHFSQRQAQVCFQKSLLMQPETTEDHLDFMAYVEALARLAAMIPFPTAKDMLVAKVKTIIDYNSIVSASAPAKQEKKKKKNETVMKKVSKRQRSKLLKRGALPRMNSYNDNLQLLMEQPEDESDYSHEGSASTGGPISVPNIPLPKNNHDSTLPFPVRMSFLMQLIFWAFDNKIKKDGKVTTLSVRKASQNLLNQRTRMMAV